MLVVTCIERFKDKNGVVIGYRLQDEQGNIKDVYPEQLKNVIKQNKISVSNLTLTSDNRLVIASECKNDTEANSTYTNDFIKNLEVIKRNNKLLDKESLITLIKNALNNNYAISTVDIFKYFYGCTAKIKNNTAQYSESSYYIVSKSSKEHFILIPDTIDTLKEGCNTGYDGACNMFKKYAKKLSGTIYVVGCTNISCFTRMFQDLKAKVINLEYFVFNENNLNKLINMQMFYDCKPKIISDNKILLNQVIKDKESYDLVVRNRKYLYLRNIFVNSNRITKLNASDVNEAILAIRDLNIDDYKLKFNDVKQMLLDGYTGLNFKLSDNSDTIEYKTKDISDSNTYIIMNSLYSEVDLFNKLTEETIRKPVNELIEFKDKGIDGVEFDSQGNVTTLILYSLSEISKMYSIIVFFNHMLLELSDHPAEATAALYSAIHSKEYNPSYGGSAVDDAVGLYKDYLSIQDVLSRADLNSILQDNKDNKYTILYNKMQEYADQARFKGIKTPDTFYNEIITMCKLPSWTKTLIKNELYMLS